MAEFLSDAWLDELEQAASRASELPSDVHLVVQQVVTGAADGRPVAYAIGLREGTLEVQRGMVDDADVSFTLDRATAAAVARGDLSAQAAFLAGDLRVGGDLRVALERAKAVAAIDDVFAEVRSTTSW